MAGKPLSVLWRFLRAQAGLRVVSIVDDDTNETAVSGSGTGSAMPTDPSDELSRPHPSYLRHDETEG